MTVVLHLLNDVHRAGNGIINAVVDLSCEQAQRGHLVLVGSAGGEYVDLLARHGVHHVVVADIRRPRCALPVSAGLRQLIRTHDVEVVHAHMNYTTVVARLAVTRTRARLVATAHTAFKPDAALMASADLVIAVGAAVGEGMRRRGVPAARIRVVRNGTLGSARSTEQTAPVELKRPAVLSVAGLYPRKGIDVLVAAFAELAEQVPDAHLYVAGDGPEREALTAQAAATSVAARIHFLGFRDDAAALLRSADVFVLPSRRDPFPLVVLEAREAGCAVVGSATDGIPEACDFGRAGWLFPVDDVVALTAALHTLLTDPAALARWRAAGSDGLEDFTIARVAAEVDAAYRDVLG